MKLYKHQQEVADGGLRILNEHGMLYLALIMRYGKTPIALDILQRQNKDQSILFVTTKSAIQGIYDVAEHFNLTNLTVTNYEQLHNIHRKAYYTLVLDEAHANLSGFPKKTKRRKEIDNIEHKQTIWLSGTPNIEASPQLFHQLTCHKDHYFSTYKNFYDWHRIFGIQRLVKYTGGPYPAKDYSQTVDFSKHFKFFTIYRASIPTQNDAIFSPKIVKVYVDMPEQVKVKYEQMKTTSVVEVDGETIVANNGAAKLSKLHQLAQGHILDEEGGAHIISEFKIEHMLSNYDGQAVFYKYQADYDMLSRFIPKENLYQIDSCVTGLDLSHYDEMFIYSLTFSGANFAQCLSRLINIKRKTRPTVYVYLTKGTADKKVFSSVVEKHDENLKFLAG